MRRPSNIPADLWARFRFEASADPAVEDDQFVLRDDETFVVQVCAWGGTTEYAVNEHGQDDPDDDETFWSSLVGIYRSLDPALRAAVDGAEGKAKAKAKADA